jgi:hypothetical protein
MKHPHRQYFLLPVSLLCITGANFFVLFLNKSTWSQIKKNLVLTVFFILPLIVIFSLIFNSNSIQLQRINYVLNHSDRSDYVYDGDIRFNLFRKDLHYFWFSVGRKKGLSTFNKMTQNMYGYYDIYRLIELKKPIFISNYQLDKDNSIIKNNYKKTRFKNLFIRVE